MAKVITCNTGNQAFTLSNSAYGAMANVCAAVYGSVSNTNLELLCATYIAEGLRAQSERVMGPGQLDAGGISVTYLYGKLQVNSE